MPRKYNVVAFGRLGKWLLRPAVATLATTLAAAVVLIIGSFIIVDIDREAELANAERELRNMAVVLAEETSQAVTAANLILEAVRSEEHTSELQSH